MTTPPDRRAAASTARLLRASRDRIVELWRARVLADPDVPLADGLPAPLLVDHLPALLDEIADAIEHVGESAERGEAVGRRVAQGPQGRRHALERLRQGYHVGEIIRELSHLRAAFLELVEERRARITRAGARLVHAAIDEAMLLGARDARMGPPPGPARDDVEGDRRRAVFDRAPLGIVQSDVEHRTVVALNPAFARLTRRTADELTGQAWSALRHPEDRDRADAWLAAIGAGAPAEPTLETRMVRPDGDVVWIRETAVALRDPDGAIARVLSFVEDVTARKALDRERAQLTEVRQTFFAIASHDLRNPLGAVAVGAQTLLESPDLTPAQREIIERNLRSTRAMERMIRDFLDLAHESIPIEPREVDLCDVLRHAIDDVRSTHPRRSVELDAEAEVRGWWDPDRIEQAVVNLVLNALAHGAAESAVRVRPRAAASEVTIEVWNAGPAIPDDQIEALFQPFRRGRHAGGTGLGLGLHLVREVARAHGGTVDVVSDPSAGTTFRVRLPRASSPPPCEPIEGA